MGVEGVYWWTQPVADILIFLIRTQVPEGQGRGSLGQTGLTLQKKADCPSSVTHRLPLIFNRPGVAGAVLHTASSFIN